MSKKLIVLGNASLANYPQGGGHWSVWLQYLLGLKKLGHNVFLLELMKSSGNKKKDDELINLFFSRLKEHGLEGKGILLLFEKDIETQDLNQATPYGKKIGEVKEIIEGADILWNFCASIRRPLLEMFKHRVLIDLDPGLLTRI